MGMDSAISWTDHTYNYWRGCTPVGPGCDFCYAESRDIRYESGKDATEAAHFGVGKDRIKASEAARKAPYKIARMVRDGRMTGRKVFALSLGDFADNEIPAEWRAEFWQVLRDTPELDYLLCTKRIGNAAKMLPADFEENFGHVGILCTAVNQDEVDRDLPKLARLKTDRKVSWIGLSIEPQIGVIDVPGGHGLDWMITGGESRQLLHKYKGIEPRLYDIDWARTLIAQGESIGAAVFVKQLGANPVGTAAPYDGMGKNPAEWPEDIRVQDFPPQLLARA